MLEGTVVESRANLRVEHWRTAAVPWQRQRARSRVASSLLAAMLMMLLAGTAGRLAAQAGVVRGRVVRADLPVGLPEADVVLRPSGAMARSDSRGFFEFRDVTLGPAEVTVRRVGYAPVVVTLQVDGTGAARIDIPLEPVATVLDPIVTSVTREQRSLSEVAAAVSVADSSAIDRGPTIGLHETLRQMPGVQAASQYGTDQVSIGIRGSAARGAFALRGLAVLLDGIPLTESDGRTRLDMIELAATRQIEVVRGPASAVYAGSPGGVVNVVSRTGRDSPGLAARAVQGAFGLQKYDAEAGGVLPGGRASGFAAASYTSADGYRAHSDGSNTRGQAGIDWVPGAGTRVALEATASSLDLRLPGTLTQAEFDADPDAVSPTAVPANFRRADSRYRAGLRLEQATGAGTVTGYFFYGGRTLDFRTPFGIVDLNAHRSQGGARFRSGSIAGSAVAVTAGFDYDNLFGIDQRWQNVAGEHGALRDDGAFSVPNLGVYAEAAWQLARAADVTLGLREDRVTFRFESYAAGRIPRQETSFDHLSPRLAGRWSPNGATSVYASIGRGTEVPIIGELSDSPGAPLRTSLRPKTLWNYEVGARRMVAGRVLLEGTVFYADVRGEFVPITVDGMGAPENASRSRDIGVELGVTARPASRLELGASYTFLDLRLQDYTSRVLDSTGTLREVNFNGKRLPAVPQHRATANARIHPVAAVDVGAQLEWQSRVFVETGNAVAGTWYFQSEPGAPVQQAPFRAIPARALVHLDAGWHLGWVTLVASVENLFGLRYVGTIEPNESLGRFYEAGPPASVSLGLRLAGGAPRAAPHGPVQ
jgi:iron complex outermembrane receptor protein